MRLTGSFVEKNHWIDENHILAGGLSGKLMFLPREIIKIVWEMRRKIDSCRFYIEVLFQL